MSRLESDGNLNERSTLCGKNKSVTFLHGNAGQQTLCDQFWEDRGTVYLPIWRFLDDCRALAPAVMTPLLRILSALATGQQAAFQVPCDLPLKATWTLEMHFIIK